MALLTLTVFGICGRSLMSAIDKSLQQNQQQQQMRSSTGPERDNPLEEQGNLRKMSSTGWRGVARLSSLAAAKKRVKLVMTVTIVIIIPDCILGVFAIFTKFGIEVPLVVTAGLTYPCLIWLIINIQLHAGRSGSPARFPSSNDGLVSFKVISDGFRRAFFPQHRIAPAEVR